tara:strand:- start:33132 stop:33302 length:171 start_codon:yes stop_codon:yes gene_type:complete
MIKAFSKIDFAALKGKFKKPSKNLFWAWIAYQAVKGTLTTSLIWAPLIYTWLHTHS